VPQPFAVALRPNLGGDPPDCVLLGDARDGISYGGLETGGLPARFSRAALIASGGIAYFREGGELLLDAGAFLQNDRMGRP